MGAGIGGLAAAHRLQLLSAERGFELELVVLESAGRAGGVLGSELCEGSLLERGPDSLVTHKPAGIALCLQLGLGDRLFHPAPGRTDILHGGRLLPVPAGFALLAPTRVGALLASPLLGWAGKLRALAEPLVPRARPSAPSAASAPSENCADADESVGSFVRRRYGAELLERIAEPIVGAIYMADVERLSLAATFPRFLALEREKGSLTRGLRSRRAPRTGAAATAPTPAVAALSGGLGRIADALVARLPAGSLRLNRRVERLRRDPQGFTLQLTNGEPLAADALLLATPAHAAAVLARELDPALAAELGEIRYASCVTVNLGWPRRSVERPPLGSGFFVPACGGSEVVAGGFLNVKFPDRVPPDQIVARLFLGGAARPEVEDRTDAELAELGQRALAPLLGVRESPAWSRVFRHPQAMPQLAVGHLALVARLRARLADQPGLELAGGPVGAYGLPDSIAAAEGAAARLFDWIVSRIDSRAAPTVERRAESDRPA